MTTNAAFTPVPGQDAGGSADAADRANELTRMRVLLVEDNDGDAALVEASLAESSTGSPLRPFVDLCHVRTLREARHQLGTATFDAVLLDLGLPDSLGLETLFAVRSATELGIVVLTGLADEEIAVRALREGAQDYLMKRDVGPAVTLRALRYARERRQQERALARSQWLAGIGDTVLAVTHELNNPLTLLMINAELLVSGDPDPELARSILEAAKRIADVTRRLGEQGDRKPVERADGIRMLDLSTG